MVGLSWPKGGKVIEIKNLTQKDIGRWVVYNDGFHPPEKGRIKSWNDKYIFVVYRCNGEWERFQDFAGVATRPEDLEFLEVEAGRVYYGDEEDNKD